MKNTFEKQLGYNCELGAKLMPSPVGLQRCVTVVHLLGFFFAHGAMMAGSGRKPLGFGEQSSPLF